MVFGRHSLYSSAEKWQLPRIVLGDGEEQVEYVRFSGMSRIDTGITFTDNTFSVKAGVSGTKIGDYHFWGWFGPNGTTKIHNWRVGHYAGIYAVVFEGGRDYQGGFVSWIYEGTEYKASQLDNGGWPLGVTRVAGTRVDMWHGIPGESPVSIPLNCQRLQGNSYNGYMDGTFYYFAVYHGNEAIMFLVPVVKSGTVGMKDMVTRQMFYPTGLASAGPSFSGNPVPRFTEPEYFT